MLNYYISKDIYLGQRFEEMLQELLPTLTTTRISNEFDKLVFRMGYSGKQFDLSDMSDGTLKAMLLTLLIFVPVNGGFSMLAIDEPEMNLHPAWQKCICKWIQLSKNFRQCFISTHSPDFLDGFTDGFMNDAIGLYVFNNRTNEPILGGWPW